jgi:hypothetical protein
LEVNGSACDFGDVPIVNVLLFVFHEEIFVSGHQFEFKILLAVISAVPLSDVPQCCQVKRSVELKHKAAAD